MLKRREFRSHQRQSRRFYGKFIIIDYRRGNTEGPKLGITVTRRFGKATDRNRFKRLCREAFRLNLPTIPADLTIHMRPTPAVKGQKLDVILTDLKTFLPKPLIVT